MSRIGKAPIKLSPGLSVSVVDAVVTIKGTLGELSCQLLPGITVEQIEDQLLVMRTGDSKELRARHGLTRALLQNIVTGVSEGYLITLHVIGTGYSAERLGPWLRLSLGYSHDVMLQVPQNLTVEAEAVPRSKGTRTDLQAIIHVKGIDKQLVGQYAADIRRCHLPENYKGKGIRYLNEAVTIKTGKAGSK